MKDIIDEDDTHAKRVCKYFKITNLSEYHGFYLQSDLLLLADVWELSKYMSWNTWTRLCSFSYCTRIKMVSIFKKYQSKIRSFNWYWFVINGKKGVTGRICHAIHRYANNIYYLMESYDKKIKNHHILSIGIKIIYTDRKYHKSFLEMVLSGLKIHLNLTKIR